MRLPLLGTFMLLAAALALGTVWGVGYGLASLESLAALVVSLLVATLLALVGAAWSPLRMALLALLLCLGLDVFFLEDGTLAWGLLVMGPLLAALLHRRLPPQAFAVAAAVFLGGLALQQLQRVHPTAPPHLARTGAPAQIVVHWVLDEMGSFASVPEEYQVSADMQEIEQGYRARGFALHADKPSTSVETFLSLSRMAGPADAQGPNYKKVGSNYRLLRNAVHEQFRSHGWDVSVTQSSYLDFCGKAVERCVTYDVGNNARVFSDAGLDLRSRAIVLLREVMVSLRTKERGSVLMDVLRPRFPQFFARHSSWSWARPSLSLATLRVMEGQVDYVTGLDGKHYVFAHILSPHFPWNLDRNCAVRPLAKWRTPYAARSPKASPETRAAAFEAYWQQQICTHRRVLAAIDRIDAAHPGRVQFLIHGDHGPRILKRHVAADAHRQAGGDVAVRNAVEPFLASRLRHAGSADVADVETMQDAARVLLSRTAAGELPTP